MAIKHLDRICSAIENHESVFEQGDTYELVIERPLPFLCLHRYLHQADWAMKEVVETQASYLIIKDQDDTHNLVRCIYESISKSADTFLVLEFYPGPVGSKTFKIFGPSKNAPTTIGALKTGLGEIGQDKVQTEVVVVEDEIGHNPELDILFTTEESASMGCLAIQIEIPPIYQSEKSKDAFPIFYRGLKAHLSEVIKKTVFEFIRVHTSEEFNHYLMFGKTQIDEKTEMVDRHLATLTGQIDFLLRVSPLNTHQEWKTFKDAKYKVDPQFHYRLIAMDPELEKRKLSNLPIEEISDTTMAFILRDKRSELENKLNMLVHRGSAAFKYYSMIVYGVPSAALIRTAESILKNTDNNTADRAMLTCHDFAALARKEIKYYQSRFDRENIELEIRDDVTGLLVSNGKLLIGKKIKIRKERAKALLQHEVGTHVLTYYNGKKNPLQQLAVGLAGYEELQEGIAVLGEYFLDGMTTNRLRILASRVLAVASMIEGIRFHETFQRLVDECGLKEYRAFNVATRVYRGGGLTKDMIYLKGLVKVINYLAQGGSFELLYTGKFGLRHIPVIEELKHRKIIATPVLPNHYEEDSYQEKLQSLKKDMSLLELLN